MSWRAKKIVVCFLNIFFFFFGDNGNFIDIKKKKIKFPKYIESIQLGTIQSATQVT